MARQLPMPTLHTAETRSTEEITIYILREARHSFSVFVLDPTPGTANKGEHMKHYYRTITQIEENIIKVVRLKPNPNYEVKQWHHCITDNVSSCSR
jgi:hypothetical protein